MPGPRPTRVRTSDLKSRFMNVAQTSVYMVKLQPPSAVTSFLQEQGFNYNLAGRDVELMCSQAQLPSQNLSTHEANNDYTGVNEKMAYRKQYDDVSFTFNVNNRYDVIQMFDSWIDYIAGQTESNRDYLSPYATLRNNYPNKYKSNVYITKFEKGVGNPNRDLLRDGFQYQLDYTFVGAFPISSQPVEVNYSTSNVLQYSVSMTFIRYVRQRSVSNLLQDFF
jgi:hypothetical protein